MPKISKEKQSEKKEDGPHKWTKFEINSLLAILARQEYQYDEDKMALPTEFNRVLNRGRHENDLSPQEIWGKFEEMKRKRPDFFAIMNRQETPHITRLLTLVWKRGPRLSWEPKDKKAQDKKNDQETNHQGTFGGEENDRETTVQKTNEDDSGLFVKDNARDESDGGWGEGGDSDESDLILKEARALTDDAGGKSDDVDAGGWGEKSVDEGELVLPSVETQGGLSMGSDESSDGGVALTGGNDHYQTGLHGGVKMEENDDDNEWGAADADVVMGSYDDAAFGTGATTFANADTENDNNNNGNTKTGLGSGYTKSFQHDVDKESSTTSHHDHHNTGTSEYYSTNRHVPIFSFDMPQQQQQGRRRPRSGTTYGSRYGSNIRDADNERNKDGFRMNREDPMDLDYDDVYSTDNNHGNSMTTGNAGDKRKGGIIDTDENNEETFAVLVDQLIQESIASAGAKGVTTGGGGISAGNGNGNGKGDDGFGDLMMSQESGGHTSGHGHAGDKNDSGHDHTGNGKKHGHGHGHGHDSDTEIEDNGPNKKRMKMTIDTYTVGGNDMMEKWQEGMKGIEVEEMEGIEGEVTEEQVEEEKGSLDEEW
ncbi:MAG: kinesin-like nuclear fusion protein [Watsoniomyces obsoletus]|nr:MAG: kinesin-like nuclear fusion protein [Watsoniomyces obsoletus]